MLNGGEGEMRWSAIVAGHTSSMLPRVLRLVGRSRCEETGI